MTPISLVIPGCIWPPKMSRIRELIVSLINRMEKKVPHQKHHSFEFAFSPIKFRKEDLQNHSPWHPHPHPNSLELLPFLCISRNLCNFFSRCVTRCDTSPSAASSQGISEAFENEQKTFQMTLCHLKPRIPSSGKDQSRCLKARQRWYFGQ